MSKPYKGFFITIEGGDGCGKSTLTVKLVDALQKQGYSVIKTREPGGSPLSEKIRELVLSPTIDVKIGERSELLLFLAARLEHIEEKILPALREGKVVVCDRFNDSSIVYQGCARHHGMEYVENICHLACNGLKPDFTLFLDLDPEEGLKRLQAGAFDRLDQEKLQFHKEVRHGYLHLADKYSERISIVDASLSPDQVFNIAMEEISNHLTLKPPVCG